MRCANCRKQKSAYVEDQDQFCFLAGLVVLCLVNELQPKAGIQEMNKKTEALITFEEKKGKTGQRYFRGVGEYSNYYLFLDKKQATKKSVQNLWNLVIKPRN